MELQQVRRWKEAYVYRIESQTLYEKMVEGKFLLRLGPEEQKI